MTTSAVGSSAETTVSFYCHACTARFSLPAPSSPFHFTLCPRCRECYLDDDDDCAPDPQSPPEPEGLLLLPPPLPPWLSSPSGSSSSAMTRPPPPPVCVLWPPRSSVSSGGTMLPLPPIPSVVRSSSSSCTRPSSSSTRPPPMTSSGSATSSAAPAPYYCTEHSAVAAGKQAQRRCRFHDSHEEQPDYCSSSSTVSPPSSPNSSTCSSPLLVPPPPPPLHHGELEPAFTFPSPTIVENLETVPTSQGLCPPPPPPPLPLASGPFDAWDYFFFISDEESLTTPTHRDGQQPTPTQTLPPPPVSTYDSMLSAPLQRGGPQAASPAAIAALPTVTVTDTDTDTDTALVCPICTDPLLPSAAARRLPCDHLYHSDCIETWLSLRDSCPVCRRSIPMLPSTTTESAPSASLPQQQTPGRRRSLPGARRIRRICGRLLRSMQISRGDQTNTNHNVRV